jgi:hypothetical protein
MAPSINSGSWRTTRGHTNFKRPAVRVFIRAVGSNGVNGAVNGFKKQSSPSEMTIADLSPTLPSNSSSSSSSTDVASPPPQLPRKVAVPPRQPVPTDALNTMNGQGRKIPAQAQKVLDQYVSLTGGGALTATTPNGTELAAVESKLKRQAIELREAKAELA